MLIGLNLKNKVWYATRRREKMPQLWFSIFVETAVFCPLLVPSATAWIFILDIEFLARSKSLIRFGNHVLQVDSL